MRSLNVLLVVVMGLFSTPLLAETKIGVVDLAAVIFRSDIAQKRLQELQKGAEFSKLQAKYESTAADIKALQKDAEGKSMTWSDDQKVEFQKKMEYLRAEMNLTVGKLESESNAVQNSLIKDLQPKALEALQEMMTQEGISVIIRKEAAVIYKPELDITAKLTERLNSKTK